MPKQTEPIEPADATTPLPTPTPTPPPTPAPVPAPALATSPRRTVTLPLLPLVIVGGVIVGLLFFGGGVALGLGIGAHDARPGVGQHIHPGQGGVRGNGANGDGMNDGYGFGSRQRVPAQPGQGQPGSGQRIAPPAPFGAPTGAPNNG